MQRNWPPLLLAGAIYFAASGAQAQRAGDNAVTAAQDAFGTTVGNESVGLYSTTSARGFSPVQAGNLRLEGLYFFQPSIPGGQNGLDSHLSRGSTVRVGLTAQSYPFPAPTGIADFQLRLPGNKLLVSTVTTYGPYETYKAEVDAHVPLLPDKLGLVVGAGGGYQTFTYAGDNTNWSVGGLLHWRPTDDVEIIPFYSRRKSYDWESFPIISPAGPYLPPKVKRRAAQYQRWLAGTINETNFGALARFNIGLDWTLRAGLFRAANGIPRKPAFLMLNMQPDGTSDAFGILDAPENNASLSGEVRLSGRYAEGPRRHTIHIATRGHTVRRRFGGGVPTFMGKATVGIFHAFPEPPFVLGESRRDKTRQGNVGATYVGLWDGIGELSAGVQKVFYRRKFEQPGSPLATSRSQPWLYNGTAAFFVADNLTLYGSYTRGLEESGLAPESAANRGQPQPANITEQLDAGVRYAFTPRVRLVAGVFEVKKPYLNRDAANIFTTVGAIKHRGIELSLSGQPVEGLTVIAGAVLLRARVSGFTVDQGLIGKIPPSATPRLLRLNVQYGPPSWGGLSVETQVNHESARQGDRLNTFKNPAKTIIDLGARAQFSLFRSPASFRVQVLNVTNKYFWNNVGDSGFFQPGDSARRYMARLSVDF